MAENQRFKRKLEIQFESCFAVTERYVLASCQWNLAIYDGKFNARVQRRGCNPLPSMSIRFARQRRRCSLDTSELTSREKEARRSKVKLRVPLRLSTVGGKSALVKRYFGRI